MGIRFNPSLYHLLNVTFMKNWMLLLTICSLAFSLQAQDNERTSEIAYSTWVPQDGTLEQVQHFAFQTYTERFNEVGELIETMYYSKWVLKQTKQYFYLDGRLEKSESKDASGALLMITQYTYNPKGKIQEEIIQILVSGTPSPVRLHRKWLDQNAIRSRG